MNFFRKLFSVFGIGSNVIMKLLEMVSPIMDKAYPIVKQIALLTPNKTDDQIIRAYEFLGFAELFSARNNLDRSLILRELAKDALRGKINNGSVPDYLINTAIELAYAKYKQEETEDGVLV
jgi:hypothetical protein